MASRPVFSGTSVTMSGDLSGYKDVVSSLPDHTKDVPVIVIDIKGMQRKDIVPDILKNVKIRNELWFMTGIRNAGDVMDAFHGNMDKLIVPYHLTSDTLLKEITELSDSCIPSLFADEDGVLVRGKRKDIRTVIRTLEMMHFSKILIFDASGGSDLKKWHSVRDAADIIIPFCSAKDADAILSMGFADVMVSAAELS